MYKHVIWDWNGTLLEDVNLCVTIMNNILTDKRMKTMSVEYYRDIFTIPVIEYYKTLGFDFSEETFESVGKRFIDTYENTKYSCNLYPGSEEILTFIRSVGTKQSVLSGYYQETLDEIIKEFRLTDYFDYLVGMNDIYAGSKVTNGKRLIELLNLNGDEVLLIGDTCHDYEVAREIGADAVLLSCGHQPEDKLRSCDVPVLSNHKELYEYLIKKLNGK